MGRQLRKTKVIDPQVQKELIYLRDPLKHSNRVRDLLAEGRYDFALALTEAASSRMSCVVSWNHLVNHLMMQRRDTDAIKLYNQVKLPLPGRCVPVDGRSMVEPGRLMTSWAAR